MAMNKLGLVLLASILALPIAANAQIYKWKDKDGVMRYSDMPPPGNTKYESLGGKKPASERSLLDAPATDTKSASPADVEKDVKPKETPEQVKERERVNEANQKAKQQNCSTARANLQAFQRGGRITRMNEQGEPEYFDDEALARGVEQAQKDVAEFCE